MAIHGAHGRRWRSSDRSTSPRRPTSGFEDHNFLFAVVFVFFVLVPEETLWFRFGISNHGRRQRWVFLLVFSMVLHLLLFKTNESTQLMDVLRYDTKTASKAGRLCRVGEEDQVRVLETFNLPMCIPDNGVEKWF